MTVPAASGWLEVAMQLRLLKPRRLLWALGALLALSTLSGCPMNDLPRNMNLKSFNPHRATFACVHEAVKLPLISTEAEALFQQGLTATSYDLWPNERDYKLAAQLWQQAADKGHWKAALNLAGLYESGLGVSRDRERAVVIVEGLMKQGVPAAFDKMGTYHQSGIGVIPDRDRAFGFWQLAADMGNPAAQTFIGEKLDAAYDSASMGVWANRPVAIKMLECAFAQGYGAAAYELGATLDVVDKNYGRALIVLHEGVKFGSKDAAGYLFASFDQLEQLNGNLIDRARAARYGALTEALELNPDLRFPNLDKVLPLPPADLPFWDGKPETLVDAAKAVIVKAPVTASPASLRTGRARIPEGYALRRMPQVPNGREILAQYEGTPARATGFWLPESTGQDITAERFNAAAVPMYYREREPFEEVRQNVAGLSSSRIMWHYLGLPVRQDAAPVHPYVAQGRARHVPEPAAQHCRGSRPCPATGIWLAKLKEKHADFATWNSHVQQAYVIKGDAFSVPTALHEAGGLTALAQDLMWQWLGQANQGEGTSRVDISLTS